MKKTTFIFCMMMVLLSLCVSATWFNTSWAYSVNVSVNSTANITLNNYIFPIIINTSALVTQGKVSFNCSDLRITDSNDNILSFEIEACNTPKTILWIKGNLTANINNNIVVYYGNNLSSAVSDSTIWASVGYASVWHGQTMLDSVGNNNLTTGAGQITQVLNESCKWGYCLRYNTTATYAYQATIQNLPMGTANSTIQVWYKNAVQDANRIDLIAYGNKANNAMRALMWQDKKVCSEIYGNPYTCMSFNYTAQNVENMLSTTFITGQSRLTCLNGVCETLTSGASINTATGYGLRFGNIEAYADFQPARWGAPVFYDEVRIYNGSLSSDWIKADSDTISILGIENIYSASPPNTAPIITFNSQVPSNLTIYNTISQTTNITFNYSNINVSTFKLIWSVNNTDNVFNVINGTAYNNPQNKSCSNISASQELCQLYDNEILRGIYNYNQSYMENAVMTGLKTFSNANDRLKTEFKTIIATQQTFVFFEFNCNGSSVAPMNLYFYNSSNQSVLIASIPGNTAFNHRHSAYSAHHVIGIPINQTDYTINGVKITPTFYTEIRGSAGSNFVCFGIPNKTRDNAVMGSSNGGTTYSEIIGTTDMHIHRFGNDTTFRYKGYALNDTGSAIYSSEITDNLERFNIPPTAPGIDFVSDRVQNVSQLITWSASVPLNPGASIINYSLNLYTTAFSLIREIARINALSYNYSDNDTIGGYVLGVYAFGSDGYNSSVAFSNEFNITLPCISSFNCSSFGACGSNNISQCLAVTDITCGEIYEGNINDFDESCVYTPPNVPILDLTTTNGVILLGILIFFWIGLAFTSLMFRNFALGSFMWFVGLILGFMTISISFILCMGFILFSTLLFMITISKYH